MGLFSVPASLVRQHCFCPRIPFYNEVMNLNPGDRMWQKQGINYHARQSMLNKRRNLSRYQLDDGELHHQVLLDNDEPDCHGICDAIIIRKAEVCPLEFKLSAANPSKGHIYQLVAYGIMAQSKYDKAFHRGFILYGEKGKTVEIKADQALKSRVVRTIEEIQKNVQGALLPTSSASASQCGQCEYLNFCGDRD